MQVKDYLLSVVKRIIKDFHYIIDFEKKERKCLKNKIQTNKQVISHHSELKGEFLKSGIMWDLKS